MSVSYVSNLDLRQHMGKGKVDWCLVLTLRGNSEVIKLEIHNLHFLPTIK